VLRESLAEPLLPFKKKIESGEWAEFLCTLKKKDLLGTLSYQRVLELGAAALNPFSTEQQTWDELKRQVQHKIISVESKK
jgi:hypothetical protein